MCQNSAPDGPSQTYERPSSESVTTAVVRVVAAFRGEEPGELDPLYESVDPDALNAVVDRESRMNVDIAVEFDYSGYRIHVSESGEVQIFDLR